MFASINSQVVIALWISLTVFTWFGIVLTSGVASIAFIVAFAISVMQTVTAVANREDDAYDM